MEPEPQKCHELGTMQGTTGSKTADTWTKSVNVGKNLLNQVNTKMIPIKIVYFLNIFGKWLEIWNFLLFQSFPPIDHEVKGSLRTPSLG